LPLVTAQIGVIEDVRFGTRFYLSSGAVRGQMCAGGTAVKGSVWLAKKCMHLLKLPQTLDTYPVTVDKDGWLCISQSTAKQQQQQSV
jgi:hypothetical protein